MSNTEDYDCDIHSVTRMNTICGAGLLGLGLLMHVIAFIANKWDDSIERNIFVHDRHVDPSHLSIDVGKGATVVDNLSIMSQVKYMKKYIEVYSTEFCNVFIRYFGNAKSSNYDNSSAAIYAKGYAVADAHKYAQVQALKYVSNIDNGDNAASTLGHDDPQQQNIVDGEDEQLMNQFPNWYRHKYRSEFIQKFCDDYTLSVPDTFLQTVREFAHQSAIELVRGFIENSSSREDFDDEAMSEEGV